MSRSRKVGGRRLKNHQSPAALRERGFQLVKDAERQLRDGVAMLALAREREAQQIDAERRYFAGLERRAAEEKASPDEETAFMLGHLGRHK